MAGWQGKGKDTIAWNGHLEADSFSGNGSMLTGLTAASQVSDTAYAASWDGVTTIAPSKNAVYDKIETLGGVPAGTMTMWGGTIASVPAGWLWCGGQAVSRTTYSALFSAIGTTWGAGDGSTTFNLPPFKSRYPIGAELDEGGVPKAVYSGVGYFQQYGSFYPIIDASVTTLDNGGTEIDAAVLGGAYSANSFSHSHGVFVVAPNNAVPFIIKT